MSKRRFVLPYVTSSGGLSDGGDDTVIGGGSGQGDVTLPGPTPCSYAYWKDSEWTDGYDVNDDGVYSIEEFAYWWIDNKFTMADWAENNPDIPWNPDWED